MTVHLPDTIAARFGSVHEADRYVLEAVVLTEYRAGGLTRPEAEALLDIQAKSDWDAFVSQGERVEPKSYRDMTPSEFLSHVRAFRADKTLGGLDPKELIREGRR